MCSICGRYDGMHDYRCPYYSPLRPKYLCCYCGEGIYQGERYLDNWLGFKYKEMEDYDE